MERGPGVDYLTGLRDSRALRMDLDALRVPAGVLVADLHGFRGVNDALGHAAGDRCLVRAAQALGGSAGPGTYLYRSAGDEFTLVAPRAAEEELAELALRARRRFEEQTEEAGLTLSLGWAAYDPRRDGDLRDTRLRARQRLEEVRRETE